MHPANPLTDASTVRLDPKRPVRVALADGEGMFRASLRQLLTAPPSVIRDVYGVDIGAGFDVVGEAGTGEETVAIVQSSRPDLLMLDLALPRMSGLAALRQMETAGAPVRSIILSGHITKADLYSAIQLRVRALVRKDEPTELLFEAIVSALAGRCWVGQSLIADLMELVREGGRPAAGGAARHPFGLTRREREVLALVVSGYANKEIAKTCAVSEETIKHHLTRMFDKVGASNRLELAMLATQAGLLNEP